MSFTPKFRNDVFATNAFTGFFLGQINPLYCLTDESAAELVAILSAALTTKPSLTSESPIPSNSFVLVSAMVPILNFNLSTGLVKINAGLIANYWNHGYSDQDALTFALADLKNSYGVS